MLIHSSFFQVVLSALLGATMAAPAADAAESKPAETTPAQALSAEEEAKAVNNLDIPFRMYSGWTSLGGPGWG